MPPKDLNKLEKHLRKHVLARHSGPATLHAHPDMLPELTGTQNPRPGTPDGRYGTFAGLPVFPDDTLPKKTKFRIRDADDSVLHEETSE